MFQRRYAALRSFKEIKKSFSSISLRPHRWNWSTRLVFWSKALNRSHDDQLIKSRGNPNSSPSLSLSRSLSLDLTLFGNLFNRVLTDSQKNNNETPVCFLQTETKTTLKVKFRAWVWCVASLLRNFCTLIFVKILGFRVNISSLALPSLLCSL